MELSSRKAEVIMFCAQCRQPIDPRTAWVTSSDYYCSEFCAEAESADMVPVRHAVQKDEIDRKYLERLQRHLPYLHHIPPALPGA